MCNIINMFGGRYKGKVYYSIQYFIYNELSYVSLC